MIGSLIGGKLSDKLGRRKALLVDDFIFIVGTVLCTFAPRYAILVIGRLIVGFGVGISSSVIPLFITEISPVRIRGQIGGSFLLIFYFYYYLFLFLIIIFIFIYFYFYLLFLLVLFFVFINFIFYYLFLFYFLLIFIFIIYFCFIFY